MEPGVPTSPVVVSVVVAGVDPRRAAVALDPVTEVLLRQQLAELVVGSRVGQAERVLQILVLQPGNARILVSFHRHRVARQRLATTGRDRRHVTAEARPVTLEPPLDQRRSVRQIHY